jgi:hypothetical protein
VIEEQTNNYKKAHTHKDIQAARHDVFYNPPLREYKRDYIGDSKKKMEDKREGAKRRDG